MDAAWGVRGLLSAYGVADENIQVIPLTKIRPQNQDFGAVRVKVSEKDDNMPGVNYTIVVI